MPKFEIGEIAIIARNPDFAECPLRVGDEVEIVEIDPEPARNIYDGLFYKADYSVKDSSGELYFFLKCHLRKRRLPTTYRDQHKAADKDWQDDLRRALGQSEKVTRGA